LNINNMDQLGTEGRRVDGPPKLDSGFLYFGNRICPFAHRAWICLLEKGVTNFDYIHIDLGPSKPAWYSKVNPLGTVPCIYDEGKPVFESMIICEFLEEKYKGHGIALMPESPQLRAAVRFFYTQFGEKLKALYQLLMNQDASKTEELKNNVTALMKDFNDKMKEQSDGPFFLGKDISLADISIVTFIERMSLVLKHYREFDIFGDQENTGRLFTLFQEVKKRPAFQQTCSTPEHYIQAYSKYANPKKE